MNKRKQFIQLLFVSGLLFAAVAACDKTDNPGGDDPGGDDPGGDVQSAGTLEDADGNVYKTVEIGSQVWMAENLKTTRYNDGTEITNVTSDTQWESLTTGAYCNYGNIGSNAATYGRLYNWYAVNTGKLAPAGWHVPTDDDWAALGNYVAANTGTSGSEAKALASKTNWATSKGGGAIGNDLTKNNSTGFTALPGGGRDNLGVFSGFGKYGCWWSSTGDNTNLAYYRYLYFKYDYLSRYEYSKEYGFSVRLVRD
jgi:uncharacterized protein (TIGR02145 family)